MEQVKWNNVRGCYEEVTNTACGQTTAPLRSHDQRKTVSQLFIDGGLDAITKRIEAECEAKYMDSLEAVQKSHQEQIDNQRIPIQGLMTENISLLSQREELKNQLRKAEYPVRVLYVPVDTDKVAALEKKLAATTEELDATRRRSVHAAETSGNLRAQIADLEKQLAEKTLYADLGWKRAMDVSDKCDKAQNKLDAIKKLIDSRHADGLQSNLSMKIESLLGGN